MVSNMLFFPGSDNKRIFFFHQFHSFNFHPPEKLTVKVGLKCRLFKQNYTQTQTVIKFRCVNSNQASSKQMRWPKVVALVAHQRLRVVRVCKLKTPKGWETIRNGFFFSHTGKIRKWWFLMTYFDITKYGFYGCRSAPISRCDRASKTVAWYFARLSRGELGFRNREKDIWQKKLIKGIKLNKNN
jgi:hypothetical protein